MYVRPISARFVGGRSTPAIRAITYPCLCLCFGMTQMTRTTPSRRITLHLSQIFFTDARTFIKSSELRDGVLSSPAQLSRDPATRRIVRRQFHLDPIARNQPDKISF